MDAMNTPNLPTLPTTGALWTMAKNDATWLMKHERIVIVALVLIAGTFLGNKWLNWEGAQKDAKVAALTAQVLQDKTSVQNLALAAAQAQAVFQTTLDAITKQNASLSAAVAQDNTLLAKNQAVDKNLPLPELGKRIETLVPEAQGGVTATTNGLALNDSASHGVAAALEQVPVLKDELSKETQISANKDVVIDKAQTVNNDLTKQVSALNTTVSDQDQKYNKEVAAEKTRERKAFIHGFKWGFGLGFAAGAYVMHAL